MKCIACGAPLKATVGNYKAKELDLPNVTLMNVELRRCSECGEEEVVIPHVEELHKLLAVKLIEKRSRLVGAEVRFLRKYLGLSTEDFAEVMGVSRETVSRWENDREHIGPSADRVARLLVARCEPVKAYPIDNLRRIDHDEAAPSYFKVKPAKRDWELVSA